MLYWGMVFICAAGAAAAYFAGKGRAWRTPVLVVCVIGLVGAVMARAVGRGGAYVSRGGPKWPPVAAVESDVARAKALAQAAVSKAGERAGQGKLVVAFPYYHGDRDVDRREKAIIEAVCDVTGATADKVVGIYPNPDKGGVHTDKTDGAGVVLFMHYFSPDGLDSFAARPLTAACFAGPRAEADAREALKGKLLDIAVLEDGRVLSAP